MRFFSRALVMAAVITAASALSAGTASAQATATICKDGSNSAVAGRGACSGHGGVDSKATKAATKATKAASKTSAKAAPAMAAKGASSAAMVSCTDGSMSKSGRGACSGHGGVKAAGAGTATAAATPAPMAKPAAPAKPAPTAHSTVSNAAKGSGAKEDNNPVGAIAKCKDGLYSHSAHRQGACSRHGGVASWS